jgi:L-rhamnose mutarotase
MTRYGQIIRLRPEKQETYIALHREVWPEVLKTIRECRIRNYTIFLRDGVLFAYFEYHGTDFKADMAKMAADPKTREWWALTDPCQQPVAGAAPEEWWAPLEEVFHTD